MAILVLATLGSANESATLDEGEVVDSNNDAANVSEEEDGLDQTTTIVVAIVCSTVGIVILALIIFYFCYFRQGRCCEGEPEEPVIGVKKNENEQPNVEEPEAAGSRSREKRDARKAARAKREERRARHRELSPDLSQRIPPPIPPDTEIPPEPIALEEKKIKTRIHWRQSERSKRKSHCVQVQGSWDQFATFQTMQYYGNGLFQIEIEIPPGEVLFRFLVDGSWCLDRRQLVRISDGYEFNALDNRVERGSNMSQTARMDQELESIPKLNLDFRKKVQIWLSGSGLGEAVDRIVRHSKATSFEDLRSMDRNDIRKLAAKAKLSPIEEEKLTQALQKPSGLEE